MPIGSRMSSWPSTMNSCVSTCSTCWSVGMFTALAVSITRATSAPETSRSLMATMPLELKLLMWLPAMPVKTSLIWQAAISSASSSARRIDCTVDSMLTTTPLRRPCDSACPSPMTWKRPSGSTSATATTTFEVPMSSPTIRSLVSFLMFSSSGFRRRQGGQPVGVARVDALWRPADAGRDHRVGGDDLGQAVVQGDAVGVASELEARRRAIGAGHVDGPRTARRTRRSPRSSCRAERASPRTRSSAAPHRARPLRAPRMRAAVRGSRPPRGWRRRAPRSPRAGARRSRRRGRDARPA